MEGWIGLAVGIPLGIAAFGLGIYLIKAMLQAADKPGLSPTVIPVVMLVGIAMLLYAGNPEELAPLGDLAGVGLGGLVGLLVAYRTAPDSGGSKPETPPLFGGEDEEEVHDEEDWTAPIPGSEALAPEDVIVPDDIEELGVEK